MVKAASGFLVFGSFHIPHHLQNPLTSSTSQLLRVVTLLVPVVAREGVNPTAPRQEHMVAREGVNPTAPRQEHMVAREGVNPTAPLGPIQPAAVPAAFTDTHTSSGP